MSFINVKIKFYTKEIYCIKKYGILKKIVDKRYKKLYTFIQRIEGKYKQQKIEEK